MHCKKSNSNCILIQNLQRKAAILVTSYKKCPLHCYKSSLQYKQTYGTNYARNASFEGHIEKMNKHEEDVAPVKKRKIAGQTKGKRKQEERDPQKVQRRKTNTAVKQERQEQNSRKSQSEQTDVKKSSRKPTNKNEEEGEESDLMSRREQLCLTSQKYVGAHVSIQGGLWNAALEANRIGAKAFGLFLRSQRTWNSKALEKSAAERFKKTCDELGFESCFIVPHSPYLMNLGSPKPDVLQKSRDMLVEELSRCSQLGLTLYNIHPGSHVGEMPVAECLQLIADGINHAHSRVPGVTVVLENMCCQGSTVGGRFEELRGIIDHVKDKSRIGVCLDTCHAFAAGYNLSEDNGLQSMLDEFDKIVGLSYLKAVHLNDSKGKVGCHLDRHENIGRGHIGVNGFRQVMNEPRFNEIPMILETPYNERLDEIELLYSLCDKSQATKSSPRKTLSARQTIS